MSLIECDLLLFVAAPTEYNELKRAAEELGLEWRKQSSSIGDFWSIGTHGGQRVVVVVKAICDFADERQVEDARANRRLACANASRFVLEALRTWKPFVGAV